jgi:hypothetical protein
LQAERLSLNGNLFQFTGRVDIVLFVKAVSDYEAYLYGIAYNHHNKTESGERG